MTILAFPTRASESTPAPPALADGQRYFKVAEVAAIFECSPGMVYSLISNGDLRALDLGCGTKKRSKIRVRAEDIEAFHEANLIQPEAGAL